MIKKSRLLTILLICIPLLIAIGFSSWIIIYEVIFSPSYHSNPLSDIYGYSQTVTYNRAAQVPQPLNNKIIDGDISYEYKLEGESEDKLVDGKPIDAGTYDVVITVTNGNDAGTCQVKFIIEPIKVRIANTEISVKYGDCNPYWTSMGKYIESQVFFKDSNENDFTFEKGEYSIKGMHNGVYYYGEEGYYVDGLKTSYNIAGSTYTCDISLLDSVKNNFEFIGGNSLIVKYKTVYVETTLYTIEDAITQKSDNIVLLGANLVIMDDVDNIVETCFSKILPTSSYSISGRTLKVPYNNSSNDFQRIYNNTETNVYSALYIPDGITLSFSNSAKLIVGSIIDHKGIVEKRGVLKNDGTINFASGCKLLSYGYTKGDGKIYLSNGAEAVDVFYLDDWAGAGDTLDLVNNKAFPVKKWSVHNITCETIVYAGAIYNSVSYIYLGSLDQHINVENIYIVGNSSTSNYLFRPVSDGASNNYIIKKAIVPNDTYYKSNQNIEYINDIKIKGNYCDGNVKITVSAKVIGFVPIDYSFSTAADVAVTIDYYNITVLEGGYLTLSNSSYIFLSNKCLVEVQKNATLSITKSESQSVAAYVAFLNGGKIKMNGTLTGLGSIGGIIECTEKNALSEISSYSKDGIILKTGSATFDNTISSSLIGNIGSNKSYTTNQEFDSNKLYISEEASDGNYYFAGSSNFYTYYINYDTNGGDTLPQTVIRSFDSSYDITLDMLSTPEKRHYKVDGWVYKPGDSELPFNEVTLTNSNNTLNVKTIWGLKSYKFSYLIDYEDESGNLTSIINEVSLGNMNAEFNINSFVDESLPITTTAGYQGKTFNGWYLGLNENIGYYIGNSLSLAVFEAYLDVYEELFLYAKFTDYKQYTIYFDSNNQDFSSTVTSVKLYPNENVTLPNTMTYNNNHEKQQYCTDWYYTEDKATNTTVIPNIRLSVLIDSMVSLNNEKINNNLSNNEIYLYANWVNKDYTVQYYDRTGAHLPNLNQYYNSTEKTLGNKSVLVRNYDNTYTDSETNNYSIVYKFEKWKGLSGNTYNPSSTSSFVDGDISANIIKLSPEYLAVEEYCTITFNCSNAKITIECDSDNSINNTTHTEGTLTVPRNIIIKFNIEYTEDRNQSTTINNKSYTSGSEYKVSSNITVTATSSGTCLASGTLINMADGTIKKVEEIKTADQVLVFNHLTGKFDTSIVMYNAHDKEEWKNVDIINLVFDNGQTVKMVTEHAFFNLTLNEYSVFTKENVESFIGDEFFVLQDLYSINKSSSKLIDVYYTNEFTGVYSPVTANGLNCFTDGFLSITGDMKGFYNIFEFDENQKYDEELMNQDIEKYGLFTYEDFKEYVTEILFDAYQGQYLKVSIGKGHTTFEEILQLIDKYINDEKLPDDFINMFPK